MPGPHSAALGAPSTRPQPRSNWTTDVISSVATVALPVLVVLLLLMFRRIVALLLPLVVALVAIAGALLILLAVGQVSDLSSYRSTW
jgi:predicted RND superfamily exporter protein